MKKFRTWHDARIDEVEVVRETAKFVAELDGQRWAKRNADFRNYFDTWAEARQFLIDREIAEIADLERQLVQHQEALQKIEEMSQP
jgi:hypothetical protein